MKNNMQEVDKYAMQVGQNVRGGSACVTGVFPTQIAIDSAKMGGANRSCKDGWCGGGGYLLFCSRW